VEEKELFGLKISKDDSGIVTIRLNKTTDFLIFLAEKKLSIYGFDLRVNNDEWIGRRKVDIEYK